MKYAFLAYTAWGFFPVYWKLLADIPTLEIVVHRVGWTLIFYCGYLLFRGEGLSIRERPRTWAWMLLSATLLSSNWFLYIYAVNSGHVIETSLGYFINPLINVALGLLILKEKLTPQRWMALALASTGVLWLSVSAGHVPWIALSLALTFGFYGLVRKIAPVESRRGGQMEALLMIPLAIAVTYCTKMPFHFAQYSGADWVWLIASGAVTGFPLVWFAEAAKRIPLNLMGFIQYVSPSLQFLLGVVVYSESFTLQRLWGFSFVWAALIVFAADVQRHRRAAVPV